MINKLVNFEAVLIVLLYARKRTGPLFDEFITNIYL